MSKINTAPDEIAGELRAWYVSFRKAGFGRFASLGFCYCLLIAP